MYHIGENIHIISPRVKEALAERDGAFFVELARQQKDAGAHALDLNIGPQKKSGPEVMDWLTDCMQEAVPGMTLSFDTTNLSAIETGLKKMGANTIINSTSAEEQRLANVPPLAAEYGAGLIALCMEKSGIPVSADARVGIALEKLIPRVEEVGLPMEKLYIDPLVLTVSGCQEYVPHAIETVRMLKMTADPPPQTVVGLSNVSNQVPHEGRPLLNRVYMVMLMGAGLDAAILDPMDKDLYDLPPEELKDVPTVCSSLRQAMAALDTDREFLKKGDVFTDHLIDGYLELKEEETLAFEEAPHPIEYQMYYSS